MHVQFGRLRGKGGSVCLSVCCRGGEQCRFLGLCLVPRGSSRTEGRGGRAVGTTSTVETRHVLRVSGGEAPMAVSRGTGILLIS